MSVSLLLLSKLESTKNEQGFYQNKTTLYEERKRNEAPRRKKLTGFSPVGKANRGKTQSLTFAHLCWILGRCHRSVLSVFVLNVLSWILVCSTCCRVHEVRTRLRSSTYLLRWRCYDKENFGVIPRPLACYFAAILLKNEITRSVA